MAFANIALERLWEDKARRTVVFVYFPREPTGEVAFTYDGDICSVHFCRPGLHGYSDVLGGGNLKPSNVLVTKFTRSKEQVLLWFAASPNKQVTILF